MQNGLTLKYNVCKVDTGEPVYDCFVLRPDKDAAARAALRAYAVSTENKQLSYDILQWIAEIEAAQAAVLPDQCAQCVRKGTSDLCSICLFGGHSSDISFFLPRDDQP